MHANTRACRCGWAAYLSPGVSKTFPPLPPPRYEEVEAGAAASTSVIPQQQNHQQKLPVMLGQRPPSIARPPSTSTSGAAPTPSGVGPRPSPSATSTLNGGGPRPSPSATSTLRRSSVSSVNSVLSAGSSGVELQLGITTPRPSPAAGAALSPFLQLGSPSPSPLPYSSSSPSSSSASAGNRHHGHGAPQLQLVDASLTPQLQLMAREACIAFCSSVLAPHEWTAGSSRVFLRDGALSGIISAHR